MSLPARFHFSCHMHCVVQSIKNTTQSTLSCLICVFCSPGMPGVLAWTDDDFSMCFGINHLGHFLLTNLLLPRLKECAPSRVVTLTCSIYKYQKLNFQDLNYNLLPFFTYCRSKLANIYFSQELAHLTEGKGVTSYAVHPGMCFWMKCKTFHFNIVRIDIN